METIVIFVHGIGGDEETWGNFPKLINEDTQLDVCVDFMGYPTPPLGIQFSYLFQSKYQAIEDLAKSLKTVIDEKHKNAKEIILVGHSLGGLIIRKYLLEESAAKCAIKVSKVILYAVPNRGATLAAIAKSISLYKNSHLWQLYPLSDFINLLNGSWARSKIEESVDITVVVAGNDKVVTVDSAEGYFQHLMPKHIPGVGHIDVVKPKTPTDLSFTILKNAILKKKLLSQLNLQGGTDFSGWQKYSDLYNFDFCQDEEREKIFLSLLEEFTHIRSSIRIRGLSGLGKTRLVYEVVLASSQEVKDKVVYINVATENPGLKGWLKQAIDSGYEGILIVDNCKADLHKDLSEEVRREDSKLLLVTLDHGHESLSGSSTKEFRIGQLDTLQIKKLLEPHYGNRIPDLDRVASFAQGFPQMAVLIAEARISNDPEATKLNDKQLAKRLLGDIADKELAILRGCSLFDRFGCDDEVSEQYEYIAKYVVDVPAQEFYSCIKKFHNRGLIDISGRYAQLVPKPLAILLASEWWDSARQADQLQLLDKIPDSLVEPFCEQVKLLGFNSEVKELTQTLCGPQGPFGQAEAILSNRGSLLLRSFVEVNPVATASALYLVLNSLNNDQLTNITGDVRRNLVWALEKLAFHAQVFDEAAWCLMLLASAENETWSNNSTGMFAQLFRTQLSGTEADFVMRLRLLDKAIALNDRNIDRAVLSALDSAVETYVGSRTVGAEYQGMNEPLKEWRPKLWQEIFDYWTASFEMLLKFVEGNNENSEKAKNIIGTSIRGIISLGTVDILNKVIARVITLKGRYWPTALDSIKTIFAYDTKGMPKELISKLNEWLQLLTPDKKNLEERLKILVVSPPWEHQEDKEGHFVDIAAQNAEQLARELSSNLNQLESYLYLLLSGEQNQTFVFGRRLAMESKDLKDFMEIVLSQIVKVEMPNLSFLRGLLNGISEKSKSSWNAYLESFSSRKDLIKFYPDMLGTGELEKHHLVTLLELIKKGELQSESGLMLSYGRTTAHLASDVIAAFCLHLADIDAKGAWAALQIMYMHCFNSPGKFEESISTFKLLATKVKLNDKLRNGHSDIHTWKEVTKKLLITNDVSFAKAICKQLVTATHDKLDYNDIWHSIKPLLIDLMKVYGEDVWPIFGQAIISAKSEQIYWLHQLLDREESFSNKQPSVFTVLPLKLVIEWGKTNPEIAPLFVARAINIFEIDANGNKQPTDLFIALLENFSGLKYLKSELAANLGAKSWSGSLVPYLESDKTALIPLLQHNNSNVRTWAREQISYIDKSIEYETLRDDEGRLGMY